MTRRPRPLTARTLAAPAPALAYAAALAALAWACCAAHVAWAQRVSLSLDDGGGVYAGEAFLLSVVVTDFARDPEPSVSPLTIAGCDDCRVSLLGVTPQTRHMIQIINGRRSELHEVTYHFQYEVVVPRPGVYHIPEVVATQGALTARSQPVSMEVANVASSPEMSIRMNLPARPLWVGERVEVTLDWLLSAELLQQFQQRNLFSGQLEQQLPNHTFDIPGWRAEGVEVRLPRDTPAPGRGQLRFSFPTRNGDLILPGDFQEVQEGGRAWGRVRFRVELTPLRAGALDLGGASVTAHLPIVRGRRRVNERAKATDGPRALEVRPLPANAPPSFKNAIGLGFSLEAKLDRSVVKVGDPIELQVTVRGDGDLTGLILPPLDGPGGLSPDLFALTSGGMSSELVDEPGKGAGRRFRVPLRAKSAAVKEIPPLPLTFFDPSTGTYRTVHSEPLALSVRDASVVSAQDVVVSPNSPQGATAPKTQPTQANPPAQPSPTGQGAQPSGGAEAAGGGVIGAQSGGPGGVSLVGVDLGLSDPAQTLAVGWQMARVVPWLVGLYGGPLLLAGWLVYRRRSASSRGARAARGEAQARLRRALARASEVVAAEGISEVVGALHAVAAALGRALTAEDRAVMGRLETAAYDPAAARAPLPQALRDEAEALANRWRAQATQSARAGEASKAALWLLGAVALGGALCGVLWGVEARAATLDEARATYQQALAQPDRQGRVQAFSRAQALFAALVEAHPASPALLTDWGHAALGAQDLGAAVLAYRRALALDPAQARAEKGLGFVRAQALPAWAVRQPEPSAWETFLFWHQRMTAAQCLLWGAVAFCAAALLWAPWPSARARALRPAGALPALLWLWLTAASLAAPNADADAVIMQDDVTLRVADSLSAAPAGSQRLPAGAEVTILARRGDWVRLQAPNGQQGWAPAAAIAPVLP
jgi:hypothetical protein